MPDLISSLGPFLVNDFGDRYLYKINRNAFNAIGSDSLYRSLHGEKLFTEYQFNIIIGTDSGVFPKFIEKNGVPTGSRYLFIELPEVLDALLGDGQMENLPPEISITTLDGWAEQATKHQFSEYVFLDAVYSHGSLASSDAHLFEYRSLSWTLNLELKEKSHQIQSTSNTIYFVLRQLENLAENRINFSQSLVGAFSGRTAIILAGGPSLQDALPWVRENRDRVLIIAVSRISRILIAEGIVPHIVVTVDPQKISFEVSREMLDMAGAPESPLLISSFHASPLLVGQWSGKSVFAGTLFPWKTALNVDNLSYCGPTVGNYSLSIAMHLGLQTVILAGIDLCFTPQGQTHAAGSNENKIGPNLGQVSPRIETYNGQHVDTNQGYAEALHILAIQARLAAEHGLKIYNCSLGAAKIPLIEFKSLDQMEISNDRISPSEILAERIPQSTAKERLAHYRHLKKELSRARLKFQKILNLSQEALECTDGLFGTNGAKPDFRHKLKMDKIERRLDQSFGDFSVLVKQFGIRKFLTILKTPKKAEDWTDEQIERVTRDYYEAYLAGTENLIGLIDSALQRVDSRMEEEKNHPDFGIILAQWEKDGQYRRGHIWSHRHIATSDRMTAAEQDEAKRQEQKFKCIMAEEKTSQIQLLEIGYDVNLCRSKALLLFHRKELAELQTMAQGLADHPGRDKALPYLHFVNGLIAELSGQTNEAFGHYQPLLDERHPLTEDALQQIATLAISCQDVDNALLALSCLAEFSPAYLPAYGDLLKLTGNFEDAFNAYNRYLGLVPDDASAMMKLGIFCGEAGLVDAAGELFQRVLAQDPHNSAAQTLLANLAVPAT